MSKRLSLTCSWLNWPDLIHLNALAITGNKVRAFSYKAQNLPGLIMCDRPVFILPTGRQIPNVTLNGADPCSPSSSSSHQPHNGRRNEAVYKRDQKFLLLENLHMEGNIRKQNATHTYPAPFPILVSHLLPMVL